MTFSLSTVLPILEAVIADIPTLIQIVEKLVAIYKENREPTSAEWASIDALVDASHKKLQSEGE